MNSMSEMSVDVEIIKRFLSIFAKVVVLAAFVFPEEDESDEILMIAASSATFGAGMYAPTRVTARQVQDLVVHRIDFRKV